MTNSHPSVLNEFLFTRHESWHFRTFNTQHVQRYPEHSISSSTLPSKSKSSHSISMKALRNSINFWASGYAKMDCLLNPTGQWFFSHLACFQPMAAELTIRKGCKACKRPLHIWLNVASRNPLFDRKRLDFCGGKRRCFDTPWHRMFIRHRSEGEGAVPKQRGSIFRSPKARFWLGTCSKTQCFCQACIMHSRFWRCLACQQSNRRGNRMIALYNSLIKSNKTNRNDDWNRSFSCFTSFREKVFPCMSQAMIRKFPRKDRKTSEGHCRTPTVQLSSWSELLGSN